jgi:hypothetical protein
LIDVRKLIATLLQVRLAVAVIAVLGVAFVAFGILVGMPPFAYIVIGVLIGLPTVIYIHKPRKNALTNAKALTFFFGATLATMLIIQLIPYGKNHSNPPVNGEPAWSSPRTRELMVNACYGCHSNSAEYPAYASVAPISWTVQSHVDEGIDKVNYQEWNSQQGEADETIEVIREGSMPPGYYTMFGMHPEAKLTDAEISELIAGLLATPGFSEGDGE